MAASDAATARVTLVTEADATAFVEAREQLKAAVTEEWGFAPGYNDLLGLIVARALREFPYMNARLSEDGGSAIEQLPYVNLGMAVDTERGLAGAGHPRTPTRRACATLAPSSARWWSGRGWASRCPTT